MRIVFIPGNRNLNEKQLQRCSKGAGIKKPEKRGLRLRQMDRPRTANPG